MTIFCYDPALLDRYPTIRGGVILADPLRNGPTPPQLAEAFRAEQAAVLARIGATPLSEIPSLAAWRRAFSAFGVQPTQYRNAAEALLRRLTKKGDIPNISLLVDLGNLVSIRYGLPVAVFDRRATTGAVTVRFAEGDESFTGSRHHRGRPPRTRRSDLRGRGETGQRAALVLAAERSERLP